MTTHTPGPWHAKAPNEVNTNWWIEVRRGGYKSLICETTNCLGNGGTSDANAKLIAAAPDLLAVLTRLGALVDSMHVHDGVVRALNQCGLARAMSEAYGEARAAIAKATA